MSTYTHESMINHHEPGILSQIAETLHVWRQRYRSRRELAQWSDRELHDVGISWSDVAYEAEKPFWRAGVAARPASPDHGDAGRFLAPRERPHDYDASRR